ncbi:50S ribosomal protein L11 [Candidatus Nasuia deltocephalinicola]|uniref:50S ribosomal protein L11 n=1 Tax=Candidatus Nasuia deltocephalincola TaxID=1160784 RepID=UPI00216B0227|nr:50S ribosomal protein L11 [Candidatus Nasuia deltocephalinicola]
MVFKRIFGKIKLKVHPRKASPAPPIGPALGQKGLNILDFCKKFNSETLLIDQNFLLSIQINYYYDKSYDFFVKNPDIKFYLKNYIFKNSNFNEKENNIINFDNILNISRFKIFDFNTLNFYSSIKIVLGVLKSIKNINIFYN